MERDRTEMNRRKVLYSNSASVIEGAKAKNAARPKGRSLYTSKSYNHVGEAIVSNRDLGRYEGSLPKPVAVKRLYLEDLNSEVWEDESGYVSGTTVTPYGVISLRLQNRIRVDVSLNQAIRVINMKNNIVLALNASGSSSALIHPNGRVFQYGSRVEILGNDRRGNNKYAKMWYKGVSFTSDHCALVYLVDSAGTRTTTDTFLNLTNDFTIGVFYNTIPSGDCPFDPEMLPGIPHGTNLIDDAINLLQSANYWKTEDGTENWIINGIRISQTADGLVRVGRNSNKYSLRTSPSNGSAWISSPFMHCTASLGHTRHLFVRRGERRMHYDGTTFIVRNAGHSAGFDDKQQLKVY